MLPQRINNNTLAKYDSHDVIHIISMIVFIKLEPEKQHVVDAAVVVFKVFLVVSQQQIIK